MVNEKKTENHTPAGSDPLYDTLPRVPYHESPAEAVKNIPANENAAIAMRRKFEGMPILDEVDTLSGVEIPDYEDEYYSPGGNLPIEDDFAGGEKNSAIRMAFIGAGQGGGRIAQAFYDMGYRRVCVCNTTSQDMQALTIPNKLVIGHKRGGAGKDPEQGKLAANESYEDIIDIMMRSFGDRVQHVYLCVGAGGGSGTGSWPTILDAAIEYVASTNIEKPFGRHLGIIMSLPKRSEGSRVQRNAHAAVVDALEKLHEGHIASLVIVDNAKIHELYPGLPVKQFWTVANRNFAAVLHTFNLLAAKDSEYNTFDKADLCSVIQNGLMVFGMTRVEEWRGKDDISKAVRQNLKGTLLADGFDLATANMAGAIVLAHDEILSEIPMENIDYAFNSLGRALGNEGITLHNGIYESRGNVSMRVFTIISGLKPPQSRLDELAQLAR